MRLSWPMKADNHSGLNFTSNTPQGISWLRSFKRRDISWFATAFPHFIIPMKSNAMYV